MAAAAAALPVGRVARLSGDFETRRRGIPWRPVDYSRYSGAVAGKTTRRAALAAEFREGTVKSCAGREHALRVIPKGRVARVLERFENAPPFSAHPAAGDRATEKLFADAAGKPSSAAPTDHAV